MTYELNRTIVSIYNLTIKYERKAQKEISMRKSSRDLTEGNVVKNILLFALPILFSQIFQNLYHSVDSIIVGRFVGTTALAAVTASGDISHMITGFFTGLSAGAGVLFSRYFGSKDYDSLHKAIHTALTLAVIIGLVLMLVGIILTPALLKVVDCPEDVFPEAEIYLRIYLIGVLLTSMYNVASGVLRSVGDSKHPFIYLVIASLTNIVLDIVFITLLGMGVAGVALATIISQFVSMSMVLLRMLRTHDVYKLVIKDLKIERAMLPDILRLGIPAAIQTCLTSFSNLFVQRYTNSFGSAVMAGSGAAKKIDKYAGLIAQSVGLTITTFISQNIGAKKPERAFKGLRTVMVLGFIFVAVVGTPIYFFAETAMRIFTTDPETIKYGALLIHIMMPLYYFQTLHHIFGNAVRGFGKSTVTMITSICGLIVCRQLFLAVTMNIDYSVENVFYAHPVGWICSAIFACSYYLIAIRIPYIKKKTEKK